MSRTGDTRLGRADVAQVRMPVAFLLSLLILFWLPLDGYASPDAQEWMRKMAEARRLYNYEGVFVYGRGEDVSSIRIIHRFQDGEEQERLVHLDGEKREILREGDKVICVLPGKETLELEQSLPAGPFPGSYAASPVATGEQYHMTLAGTGRVAGYEAVKLAVTARDEFRHSYLLWLDQKTALPLKSLVLDAQGEVLERMQYTSLEIGGEIPDRKLTAPDLQRQNEAVEAAPAETRKAAAHLWKPQWLPEGFQEVPYQIRRVSAGHTKVDTVVYSDGLSAFSVFVENVGKSAVPDGVSRMGATIAYARSEPVDGNNIMITVVGEIPLLTARQVAESVKPEKAPQVPPEQTSGE